VWQVQARATVADGPPGSGCRMLLPDVGQEFALTAAADVQPLAHVARLALAQLGAPDDPDWHITLQSDIPIAGGLGSGAALSTALVRALFAHAAQKVTPAQVSALVFESERHYHGTPSGIDNTVIAWGTPIWFVRGAEPAPFAPGARFTLLIADSGIPAPTRETVGDVRRNWLAEPDFYENKFDEIAIFVDNARHAMQEGDAEMLGTAFDQNQIALQLLGVSSAPLERMIDAARAAGALGAKLSGGGRGGNVIALVRPKNAPVVQRALLAAGAVRVIVTEIS
jgi:mevalonate kinase